MARIITSPGVQITEKDLSLRIETPAGTNVVVPGFAAQGPTGEPIQITSASELESIYGIPTTPSERYFYYSCREILNSPAILNAVRLPYGEGAGASYASSYSGLFYPMVSAGPSDAATWQIGSPVHASLSPEEYTNILQGNFEWSDPNTASFSYAANVATLSTITYTNSTSAIGLAFALANDHDSQGIVINHPNAFETSFTFSLTSNVILTVPDSGTITNTITSTVVTLSTVTYLNTVSADGLMFALSADHDNQGIVIDHPNAFETSFTFSLTSYVLSSVDTTPLFSTSSGELSTAAGFFVLNDLQTVVNENGEGYYIGFADNSSVSTDSPNFDSIQFAATLTSLTNHNFTNIVPARLDFALSATKMQADGGLASVSESLEKVGFIGFEKSDYQDHLSFGVFKIRKSTTDASYLTLATTERYLGSFDHDRKKVSPNGGILANAFIEDIVNNNSATIKMFINPAVSKQFDWTHGANIPTSRVTVLDSAKALYPVGVYAPNTRAIETTKVIGLVPEKLDKVLRTLENTEDTTVDVLIDAGLSTVYSTTKQSYLSATGSFNDVTFIDSISSINADSDGTLEDDWRSVVNVLINFSANTRKDCMTLIDPPRSIFITGKDTKVINKPGNSFTLNVYKPLRICVDKIETNYAATYANWVKNNDLFTGRNVWLPFSGYAAAVFGRSDAATQTWVAPAGLNRGLFNNALDIAFNPNQKQRDRLYEIATNPVVYFSGDGFSIFGQKTLQNKPTAFDRINVRRLFLTLERATQRTLKYFIFEPNTEFTRTRLKSVITPIFEYAKNTEGLYDFEIVCDSRNNSGDTIDNNELIVDIYLKPVRSAEFILVNFIATRTSQNFQEII